ncbi:hypothetical protein EGH25_11135 [Haladaptatus sp. F3-133]|uniref:Uncharacterized protein n=1 Tax=Halorutilus salinus TaxID=2487751 RepID=A0A9Q4GH82_9EURY|nr:hypothetical protein [Halorutilus salinus]MCX2819904.1 hypothetical protein [Halorutilus salinus]
MAIAWTAYDIEVLPWLLLVGAVVSGLYEFYRRGKASASGLDPEGEARQHA